MILLAYVFIVDVVSWGLIIDGVRRVVAFATCDKTCDHCLPPAPPPPHSPMHVLTTLSNKPARWEHDLQLVFSKKNEKSVLLLKFWRHVYILDECTNVRSKTIRSQR